MKSVTDENTPILQAAKKYGVPESTLIYMTEFQGKCIMGTNQA